MEKINTEYIGGWGGEVVTEKNNVTPPTKTFFLLHLILLDGYRLLADRFTFRGGDSSFCPAAFSPLFDWFLCGWFLDRAHHSG